MKRILLITGGQRSGKSAYAEERALALSGHPVYVATAHVDKDDAEFCRRVARHRQRRGEQWTTVEEELQLGSLDMTGRTVLVDCVTLWCTNFFMACDCDTDRARAAMEQEFDQFTRHDAQYIFVTNEIGLGGISGNAVQRRFTDLQGFMNQYIARLADEVVLMISGIPMQIK